VTVELGLLFWKKPKTLDCILFWEHAWCLTAKRKQ